MLADDKAYRHKATRVSELSRDLSEIIAGQSLQQTAYTTAATRVAFHPPCTLQHGQQVRGKIESILQACGHELVPFREDHLCCGSAGTYSILQQNMAEQLRNRKLRNIEVGKPDVIATANIGCLLHLQSGTGIPVKHWIELLR
jgi:glycolate oxidase iron-sulfur subunit